MITPLTNRRFWFYNDWDSDDESKSLFSPFTFAGIYTKGADEYGHHTIIVPFGKGRAVAIAYRAGYKRFKHCEDCAETRKQTLEFEQEAMYVQTYWNIEDYDDVFDLSDSHWKEALGIVTKPQLKVVRVFRPLILAN